MTSRIEVYQVVFSCTALALLSLALLMFGAAPVDGRTYSLERGSDLQAVLDFAEDGDTIVLAAKAYSAIRIAFAEEVCGNCEEAQATVQASYGFRITGKGVVLMGQSRDSSIIVTNAGYGLYLDQASGTAIRNLTITGGRRNDDGRATDGAIVVRQSEVTIEDVSIRDNNDRSADSSVVVGIAGIVGREGAEIIARRCSITNGSWDGVALYRGATAVIADCTIEGGRGAGIGVTWDASALVLRNTVTGYWKGIGSFGTATLIARNNIVHDNLGWGIIATGQSQIEATNNLVYHNGNCGVAPWSSDARGRFVNNIIVDNGWRDQWVCPCVGVWNHGDWAKWVFRYNIVWNNTSGNYEGIWEQTGINGNLSVDPKLLRDGGFGLAEDSPAWQAGDTTMFNLDGTRSHIGHLGGPTVSR